MLRRCSAPSNRICSRAPSAAGWFPAWAGSAKRERRIPHGKGKRGGLRYLYLYVVRKEHIHLLNLFDKNEQEDLNTEQRDDLRRFVAWLKGQR